MKEQYKKNAVGNGQIMIKHAQIKTVKYME